MTQVPRLIDIWRIQAQTTAGDAVARRTLYRCADELSAAIESDRNDNDLLFGAALVQVGHEIGGPPNDSQAGLAAVRLLSDVWAAGTTHGIHPAHWAPVVDLASVAIDAVREARRCEQWPFDRHLRSDTGRRGAHTGSAQLRG